MKIGNLNVQIYEDLDDMPIGRLERFYEHILQQWGTGNGIEGVFDRLADLEKHAYAKRYEECISEIMNLRGSINATLKGLNYTHLAFACLVRSVDGVPCEGWSDDAIQLIHEKLKGAPEKTVKAVVKKKIHILLKYLKLFTRRGSGNSTLRNT